MASKENTKDRILNMEHNKSIMRFLATLKADIIRLEILKINKMPLGIVRLDSNADSITLNNTY